MFKMHGAQKLGIPTHLNIQMHANASERIRAGPRKSKFQKIAKSPNFPTVFAKACLVFCKGRVFRAGLDNGKLELVAAVAWHEVFA